ncbi:hypothetical protein F511_12768 [Dorcoceras hygrometricum]|uniref:Uncharacterized protein n=1 Tax=Dorcoceras hygrometricum TaxID=472368 RepID=A0A2Z7DDR7_9LAMI|nr:hypothetical protein F511_12768 [Dorcoceras hygrometricum]
MSSVVGTGGMHVVPPLCLQPQTTDQRASEACPAKPLRCLSQADSLNKERRIPPGFIYTRKDVSGRDSSSRRDMVIGKYSRNGSEASGDILELRRSPRATPDLGRAGPLVTS